jgi:hypothetical protein
MDISDKTAIVAGAAFGIGLGIVTALAEAGANVVAVSPCGIGTKPRIRPVGSISTMPPRPANCAQITPDVRPTSRSAPPIASTSTSRARLVGLSSASRRPILTS